MVTLLVLTTLGAADGAFARNQLAARVDPVGLFDEGRVGYRWALTGGISVAAAANASVSPAFARGGVSADLQLGSVLNLSAIYEAGDWFGTFGYVSGPMQQLIVGAALNLRWKRFILKSNNRLVFQHVGTAQAAFYDPNWDITFPNGGFICVNDVDALVQVVPGLRAGARYDVTHAFGGETTQRLGPLVSYMFFERDHAAFNAPTLSLVVNWWLEHPTRLGPVPFVGLAFTFRSDLT